MRAILEGSVRIDGLRRSVDEYRGAGRVTIRRLSRLGVVTLTIDRSDARNATTPEMLETLGVALNDAEASSETRAVVLRATGDTFSIGGDFAIFAELVTSPLPADRPDPIIGYDRVYGTVLTRLASLTVPTIAVVGGAAFSAGLGFVAASDIALALANATFRLPEATIGFPGGQSAPFVADRIGRARTLRMAMTGETLTATEALRIGLVDTLAPSTADLEAVLAQTLDAIGHMEPSAVRATKRILLRDRSATREATLDFAAEQFAECLRAGNAAERLAALREGREATWYRPLGEASTPQHIPRKSDPRWATLVTSGTTRPLKMLALKIMLTSMNVNVGADPSPATVSNYVNELHAFFLRHPRAVEDDASTLFG